ncbi:dienelactone hydrolase family protein [Hassallia byssoidea VB512170]|uniref:Dienelactone hydrolase family protein n=1 Tax=Hassallia byssoidea VB512170 TaxID=1304833 RepID=A0A846H3D4_9CYAN|nr:dienelactone hydrolase family protein [Hassalia byssoidea]NEU72117.1 dienelactone hydrolase family protein [Hassalia byssoidea VB512170]
MIQAIDTKTVKLSQGNLEIEAYLAQPQEPGSYPGIVVLQEIFGVNAHIREVTERIAKLGYVAIAPAIFQRIAPGFETGYTPEDIETGRNYAMQTKASELLSDVQTAIDYLKTLPKVKKDGFGCIGFCFGGHVAYLTSTLPDIKATASFYGAGITSRTPGGGAPTLTLTPDIKGTLYAFFGKEDASIPQEQVDQIEAELEKYKIEHRVFRYDGADHGFFCNHRASYNPSSAADAWEQVKQLFDSQLAV